MTYDFRSAARELAEKIDVVREDDMETIEARIRAAYAAGLRDAAGVAGGVANAFCTREIEAAASEFFGALGAAERITSDIRERADAIERGES